MIKSLHLKNFRGFEDHELDFRSLTILVGANNAGKSTIVEALRLISIVSSRFHNLHYNYPPYHLQSYVRDKTVHPSLAGLGIQFGHLFHRYGTPPALLTAKFSNNSEITIYLDDEEQLYASITGSKGEKILSQASAKNAEIPQVEIMPQIGPVRLEEEILNVDYVRKSSSSNLASLHFRNQLKIFREDYSKFCNAVEETWPGVKIQELIIPGPSEKQILNLEIRNEDFVGEVGTMGHGLQMWMQTIWFLCRSSSSKTVILDEPDIYMHADLQRKLIRYIRDKYPQVIIATHSVEIMSEVDSDCILVVDRRQKKSNFAVNTPAVQSLISRIGSAHNIHLARIWNSRRLILVEGKDIKILKLLQNKIFPSTNSPIDAIPNMSLGGWGGWDYAIGSNMLMKNAVGQNIRTYCILDRDFHTQETIQKRHNQAVEKGIDLIIWQKKEIENYFLLPSVILRIIQSRCSSCKIPNLTEIDKEIKEIVNVQHETVFDALSAEILGENRAAGTTKANQRAREIIKKEISAGGLHSLVPGKSTLSSLSNWSQQKFGVPLSLNSILKEIYIHEIPTDVSQLIIAIERNQPYVL